MEPAGVPALEDDLHPSRERVQRRIAGCGPAAGPPAAGRGPAATEGNCAAFKAFDDLDVEGFVGLGEVCQAVVQGTQVKRRDLWKDDVLVTQVETSSGVSVQP